MNVKIVTMNGVKVMDNKTNDMDWAYQNALRKEWLKNNPQAEYIGWTSI